MRRRNWNLWAGATLSVTLAALGVAPACGGGGGTSETAADSDSDSDSDSDGGEASAGEAEVIIDELGVTHIYADNDEDLMWAAGYQMAADRLFQMDLMRRRALGRRAEVLGADLVDSDMASRIFNFPRWGAADAERLRVEQPHVYGLFEAWIAGVNQRIDEVLAGDQPLPYGFGAGEGELNYAPERWSIEDPFIVAKLLMFGNSNQLEYELLTTFIEEYFPGVLNTGRKTDKPNEASDD